MPRITCKTPSTGRAIPVIQLNVPAAATTIAEAPDFSVPDPSLTFTGRDPADSARAIRPGEVFFLTPIYCRNKSTATATITVQILTEAGVTLSLAVLAIPAGETLAIPVQGLSLLKRVLAGTNGDRLRVTASLANVFDIIGTAEEKLSSEHIGVET